MGNEMAPNNGRDTEYYLEKLRLVSGRLRQMVFLISILLILCIIAFALLAGTIEKNKYSNKYSNFDYSLYLLVIALPLLGIATLFLFNITKNQGMTYYEEITDELAWGKNREEYQKRPPIEFRITIKNFLKATELPFVNGPNGQFFYLLSFVLIILVAVVLRIVTLQAG